ncbi:unnamed protein product, partial [Prorocentrum cordatum]
VFVDRNDSQQILNVTRAVRSSDFSFWTGSPAAAHVVRAIARVRCLEMVHASRLDSEGVNEVDVSASSRAIWTKWTRGLDATAKRHLEIFRGGAAKTPTHGGRAAACAACRAQLASLRHYFQDCPLFQQERAQIARDLGFPATFLAHPASGDDRIRMDHLQSGQDRIPNIYDAGGSLPPRYRHRG